MPQSVLIIEDNTDIANLVSIHLRDLNIDVEHASDGETGLKSALSKTYDLIILDLMLPKMDGIEICRRVRNSDTYTPILMLTAKSTELDRVLGLELGADDYLTKPFSIRELIARVKAIFRRMDSIKPSSEPENQSSDVINIGDLLIDKNKHSVELSGKEVDLTAKEFDLLWHFAKNPGRVYTRSQLLDLVWGYGHDGYEHTVNSHINRLRAKIEHDPSKPNYIITVWGVGYKFDVQLPLD